MMPSILDLFNLTEDQRIELIANRLIKHGETVAFIVDVEKGSHAKGDRYIRKLQEKWPSIKLIGRTDGPAEGSEIIKIAIVQ